MAIGENSIGQGPFGPKCGDSPTGGTDSSADKQQQKHPHGHPILPVNGRWSVDWLDDSL